MALNPPDRASGAHKKYVGDLSGLPQAGSPEDLQFVQDSIARQAERNNARANKPQVKFKKVSGMEPAPYQQRKTVRISDADGHLYDYDVDDQTQMALPLTASHVAGCPQCKDESNPGVWFKAGK